MPFPSIQTEATIRALAASLTPTTLAAVIVDLRANSQITDAQQDLADYAERMFSRQLDALIGRESETERLIGFLAWGAGYRRTHNGRQYGWISDAIGQNEVKAEFRRLAAKYDAQA